MKSPLTRDVVAAGMGLALALALVSVPLASASSSDDLSHSSPDPFVKPVSEKSDTEGDMGEAAYNVEDCEPVNEDIDDDAGDSIDTKDLDPCRREATQ